MGSVNNSAGAGGVGDRGSMSGGGGGERGSMSGGDRGSDRGSRGGDKGVERGSVSGGLMSGRNSPMRHSIESCLSVSMKESISYQETINGKESTHESDHDNDNENEINNENLFNNNVSNYDRQIGNENVYKNENENGSEINSTNTNNFENSKSVSKKSRNPYFTTNTNISDFHRNILSKEYSEKSNESNDYCFDDFLTSRESGSRDSTNGSVKMGMFDGNEYVLLFSNDNNLNDQNRYLSESEKINNIRNQEKISNAEKLKIDANDNNDNCDNDNNKHDSNNINYNDNNNINKNDKNIDKNSDYKKEKKHCTREKIFSLFSNRNDTKTCSSSTSHPSTSTSTSYATSNTTSKSTNTTTFFSSIAPVISRFLILKPGKKLTVNVDLPVTVSCPGTGLTANTVSTNSPANSPSHFQSSNIRKEKYLEMEIEVEKEMELMKNEKKENENKKENKKEVVIEEEEEKEKEKEKEKERERERERGVEKEKEKEKEEQKEKEKEKDDDETLLTILKFLLSKTRTAILIEGKKYFTFYTLYFILIFM